MQVIGRKTLWKGKFIKTTLITYKDRNGTVREWEAVSRRNFNGVVVVVPVTEKNELVLIRQFRPVLDAHVIELPAGLVDPGEDNMAAAKRELIEETGHTADNLTQLTEGVMSTGINTERWRIVLATGVREVSGEVLKKHTPDENEDIEVLKVPLDGIYESLDACTKRCDELDIRIFGLLELAKRKLDIGS